MSKRKDVIRDGDYVKIITPNIFVRCGYPLNKKIVMDTLITKEQKEAVVQMLLAFGLKRPPEDMLAYQLSWKMDSTLADKAFDKVIYEMAGVVLQKERWGGNERLIYYDYKPEFQDATCYVQGKRVVKTGTHEVGHSYRGYYDDYDDYDPPYLSNEHTHVILSARVIDSIDGKVPYGTEIEIEKTWVHKVDRDKIGHESQEDLLVTK